ncbi:MAG TPA: hypothetical protein VLJ41_05635 [Segetibacter sp.]|nr:hypothetical protein [Segetibacter sp.]
MRTFIIAFILLSATSTYAQQFLPGSFIDNTYRGSMLNKIHQGDSTSKKKWFFSKYSGISTSFSFFKGGSATVVSVPVGLQLNRRLNDNLYAFAGVSVAPAYVNFNRSFISTEANKFTGNNNLFKSSNLGIYSRAELGLQYINDDRTFSISGSIGVERNNYTMPFYNQYNGARSATFIPNR